MAYPANYGYFPGTLGDDGDPLDCVVVCNSPLRPGVIIEVRPIGALLMEDQAGGDEKIICVPRDNIDPYYMTTEYIEQLPAILRSKIEYFFQHYKDLQPNSWSRVIGWADRNQADKKETKDHLASRGGNFRTKQSFFAAVRSTLLRRRVFAPEGNRLLANGRSNPLKEP